MSSRSDRHGGKMVTSLFSSTFIPTVRVRYYGMLPGAQLVNTGASSFVLAANLFNVSALSKNNFFVRLLREMVEYLVL